MFPVALTNRAGSLASDRVQLVVACALTALLGGALQLHKLASLDSAGREFSRTSNAVKVSFLVPFALAKSGANLVVGALADATGRRKVTIVGWSIGTCAPVIAMIAAGVGKYGLVTLSAFFLGSAQGLVWTALVLACVDLCGKARRGFASGLNETIGYSAIAVFAEFYGSMERSGVECEWKTPNRSAACGDANAEQVCAKADDWVQQCVGECVCEGYMKVPMGIELMLCIVALLVALFLFRESSTRVAQRVDRAPFVESGGGRKWEREIPEYGDEAGASDKPSTSLRGGAHESSDGGIATASSLSGSNESIVDAMIRTTWKNKNTAIICYAAFCANFETAVAWGLVSVWARDQLGLTGNERDFFTGCYSFMKGFTQIVSGLMSDKIGRKLPISFGLIGGAISLLIACFGAGFNGKFLTGASDSDELQAMQLAYLTLSSVALGFCTGVTYPVLAAAAIDHAPDEKHYASTLGVVRFWRDLGYCMGVPIAAIADSASTEVALILVSLVMASAGYGVHKMYAENLRVEDASEQGYEPAASNDAESERDARSVEMTSR
jgi:MFS family permease